MTVLGVSFDCVNGDCVASPTGSDVGTIARAAAALPPGAPLAILIHGYRFDPAMPCSDPHRTLYADTPPGDNWKIRSWPRALGFAPGGLGNGLCIGFGWPAAPGNRPLGLGFADAYRRAAAAGDALANLLDSLAQAAPGHRIDLFAHSLGARVALRAAALSRAAQIGRVILLGAAEVAAEGRAALAAPATQDATFYNVTARENGLFDLLFRLGAPLEARGLPLGLGLGDAPHHWVDLRLDGRDTAAFLAPRGIAMTPPRLSVSHWGFYLRPGAMTLYRRILREAGGWHPEVIREGLATARRETSRRWLPGAADSTAPRAA